MPPHQHPHRPIGTEAAAETISAEMVRIHREYYGSGASDTHLDPPFVTEFFRLAPAHDVEIPEPTAETQLDEGPTEVCGRYDSNPDAPAAARRALGVFAERLERHELEVLQLVVGELV